MGDLFLSHHRPSEGNGISPSDDKHKRICDALAKAHRLESQAWRLKAGAYELREESAELVGYCMAQATTLDRLAAHKDWLGSMSAHEAEQRRFGGPTPEGER